MKLKVVVTLILLTNIGICFAGDSCESSLFNDAPFKDVQKNCLSQMALGDQWAKYIYALSLKKIGEKELSEKALFLMEDAAKNGVLLAKVFNEVALVGMRDKFRSYLNWRKISGTEYADSRILVALSFAQNTLLGKEKGAVLKPKIQDWINARNLSEHYVQATLWVLAGYNAASAGDISLETAKKILDGLETEPAEVIRGFIAKLEKKRIKSDSVEKEAF